VDGSGGNSEFVTHGDFSSKAFWLDKGVERSMGLSDSTALTGYGRNDPVTRI
jgi:hypothetical protein